MMEKEEEKVDGPGIVADILRHMEPDRQKRIFKKISDKNPEIATKIRARLTSLELLLRVPPKQLQDFLRDIPDRHLALGLKTVEPSLKTHVLAHLSTERKSRLDATDYEYQHARLSQIEESQDHILNRIREAGIGGVRV